VTPTPVIALHGQPGAGWVYAAVADRLADLGTRVLAPDRPGYGDNTAPATGILGNARWLREQITDLPAARAVVVAHSWAALPAIVAAAHSPDLVAALVLLSPAGPSAVTPTDRLIARRGLGPAATWPLAVPASGRMSWLARPWLQIAVPASDRSLARKALRNSPTRGVMASFLVEQRAMLHEMDLVRSAIAELSGPCTVVIGTADALIAPRSMIELARSLPGCEIELLNGSGHSVQLHRPAEVAEIIQRAVRS
jgi:pimeloyl-ACP methyl ester carboxylesterase